MTLMNRDAQACRSYISLKGGKSRWGCLKIPVRAMELKDFRHLVGFLEKQTKTGSCYVAHARLELGNFLCLLPKSYPNIIGMHLGNTMLLLCGAQNTRTGGLKIWGCCGC